MRGAKQRQARRLAFRSNSPTKRDMWSKEDKKEKDKETAEWEKDPGKDDALEALTQTGEGKEEDVEMTQAEERGTAIWMAEGKRLLEKEEGGKREPGLKGFTYIGKEGEKRLGIRAKRDTQLQVQVGHTNDALTPD